MSFLRRRRTLPRPGGGRARRPALTTASEERVNRLASAPGLAGPAPGDGGVLPPNTGAAEAQRRAGPAGGGWTVNTRLGRQDVGGIPRTGGQLLFGRSSRTGEDAGPPVTWIDDTGAPWRSLCRTSSPAAFPSCARSRCWTKSRPSRSITLGRDRTAKGVMYTHRGAYLNSLMEALRVTPAAGIGAAVGGAHVPLQRVVLHLGGDRDGRAAMCACARPIRPLSGTPSTRRGSRTITARPPSTSAS